MSLTIPEHISLSADDLELLDDLMRTVESKGMTGEDESDCAKEIGACWGCTVCISCRCMVWSYH